MAQTPGHTAFGTLHPAVPVVFLACTLGLTMFAPHPVLVSLSLAGALAYGAVARGVRPTLLALRWQLPLIALLACVNPLFAQRGSTLLFSLFGMSVYAESLLYGVVMAAMFMASVLWFQAARDILPQDKVLSLLGNAAPVVSLMISMTMRLIPRFVRQGNVIADVQDVALSCADANGRRRAGERRGLVRRRMRQSSVLMGWAMEDSLETADAMRARGWGAAERRTTYVRYRFTSLDMLGLVLVAAFGALCIAVVWRSSSFAFYPRLSPLGPWLSYIPYAAWMLVPAALHVYERSVFA